MIHPLRFGLWNSSAVGGWDTSAITMLQYKCNDDETSISGTASANTSTWSTVGKINDCFNFTSANSDCINSGQSLQSTFRDAFNISFWIKPDDGQPTTDKYICSNRDTTNGCYFTVYLDTNGTVNFLYYDPSEHVSPISVVSTFEFDDGAGSWKHVSINVDTDNVTFYIDSSEDTVSTQTTASATWTSTYNFYVACYNNSGTLSDYFDGAIDDFRIHDRVLTQTEITEIAKGTEAQSGTITETWTANNSTLSPLDDDIVAYWAMEDLTASVGGNLTGVNTPTFTTGKYNNAISLNGTNQYVTASDSADYDLGISNEPFTLACWFKSSSSSSIPIFNRTGSTNDWSTSTGNSYLLQIQSGTPYFYFNSSGSAKWATYSSGLADGSYHHIAITYDGTTTKMYVDGATGGTTSTNSYTKPTNVANFAIGKNYNGSDYFNGQIDEVSIWNGHGMTSSEVTALYNSGTGSFYTG